jgi:general secretion pathway protein J
MKKLPGAPQYSYCCARSARALGALRRPAGRPASRRQGRRGARPGFTLIELLTAVLILSLLAMMSYRGLGAVLDAREHVKRESEKWQSVALFFERFRHDVELAAPRAIRVSSGRAPAWFANPEVSPEPALQFSRFAPTEGMDTPQRLGYGLNAKQEIELWLWPGPDITPDSAAARYPVLGGVTKFELRYLNAGMAWIETWPGSPRDAQIPRAVQVRIVLVSGEDIMRIFALPS